MGWTHVRLAEVDEEVLSGALHTAWKLRVKKNEKARPAKKTGAAKAKKAAPARKSKASRPR
jgi:hypothetical protein